jgi:hypothetical protein
MFSAKTLFACIAGIAVLLCPLAALASAANCQAPEIGSGDAPIVSPPLAAVVIGAGRLQFFSAPSPRCPIAGVFIIAKDEVIIHAQTTDGWSAVDYFSARNGGEVFGWVRSARLKMRGTVGPSN